MTLLTSARRASLLLLIALFDCPAHAASPRFSPAISDADVKEIADGINAPLTEEPVHVLCDASIASSGRITSVICFSRPPGRTDHEMSVIRAVRRKRVAPAMVDDTKIDVQVQLSTIFLPGDEPVIQVTRNAGYNTKDFGPYHIAPQRISDIGWQCLRLSPRSKRCREQGIVFVFSIFVEVDGTSRDCEVTKIFENVSLAIDPCDADYNFIPGRVDGQPVAMRYYEPLIVR